MLSGLEDDEGKPHGLIAPGSGHLRKGAWLFAARLLGGQVVASAFVVRQRPVFHPGITAAFCHPLVLVSLVIGDHKHESVHILGHVGLPPSRLADHSEDTQRGLTAPIGTVIPAWADAVKSRWDWLPGVPLWPSARGTGMVMSAVLLWGEECRTWALRSSSSLASFGRAKDVAVPWPVVGLSRRLEAPGWLALPVDRASALG